MNAHAPHHDTDLDVAIVGGGPAGLAAAYWLARYRRRIRVLDAGAPRNKPAWMLHGYPGLDDLPPAELRARILEQARDAGAEVVAAEVTAIEGEKDAFRLHSTAGAPVNARRILLAYGRRDRIPDVPGLEGCYGFTVHHCPDCDGPSALGETVGVIGWRRSAATLALYLLTWADRTVLLTHGRAPELDARARATLERHDVEVRTAPIARVVHRAGRVHAAVLRDESEVRMQRLFFHAGTAPASELGRRLGCADEDAGELRTDAGQETSVPGVYAAGDLTSHPHLAVTAAAEGVRAALAIHRSLLPPDFQL